MEMEYASSRSESAQKWSLCSISGYREFGRVSGVVNSCVRLVNGGSIYRKEFGSLERSEVQNHMLWIFGLFFK